MSQRPTPPNPNGLERAVATVRALRAEGGCPWDRAQTNQSLRPYLLEETYETLEALDRLQEPEGYASLKEELGDVLLQVLLHAQIAEDDGQFTVNDVANALADKLVRRHPHVFGDAKVNSSAEVSAQWEAVKRQEKKKESILDGLPPGLPALQQSLKVIEKVSKVGFQWPDLKGPLDKVREELGEFLSEVEALGVSVDRETKLPPEKLAKVEAELGDLFFTLSNVAYFLHVNPEDALRSMLGRFQRRFRHVEKRATEQGKALPEMSLAEMDAFWDEAKALERKSK